MSHSTDSALTSFTTVQIPTTIGLDLSDQVSHYHVLRGDEQTLETGKVSMNRQELEELFQRWEGCRLVLEAGGHSPWVSRLGSACGLEVVVANARRVQLISRSDRKTDRNDAETLARLGRTDVSLLGPIQHRSVEAQTDLAIRDTRNLLVSQRSSSVNYVRGKLKSFGYRPPKCSSGCFVKRVRETVPEKLKPALESVLSSITQLNLRIKAIDEQIDRLSRERYPLTQLLQQVPGVGPIVSYSFVLTIDDPKRFEGRDVGAYFGLVPRQQSSGESNPQMHISKAGDHEMRRLLVLAANYILGKFGPDCDLRRFGLKIAGEGNKRNKKRARVAVARKLSVLLHRLMVTGEVYEPLRRSKEREPQTA
jgi:transposase